MNAAKLHTSLAAAVTATTADDAPMRVILKLRGGAIARGEARALSEVGTTSDYRLLSARATEATPAMIRALTDDPTVDLIWPDLPVHAWLDDAVPLVHAPRVWESGFTGRGVKVAILDTGIDPRHPDFADRIAAYRDFVTPEDGGAAPADPNGHGTHVAGIAAGSGAAADGRYRGVAPDASLVIGRVLDAAGNGRTSTVMAGIEWALDQGAQVINISLGGPPYPSDGTDALSTICNAAVAEGSVVCVAAGNLGPSGHTIGAPSAARDVITVGAAVADPSSAGDRVADFSSRGPTADGRTKPDLLFPGVGLIAPRAAGTGLGEPQGERYTSLQGTSQAAPMATGTAALLLQANPRLRPAEIKARMLRGAHRLAAPAASSQGAGRGDAYNTFVSSPGQPLDQRPAAPEERAPATPSGCLPAATSFFFVR